MDRRWGCDTTIKFIRLYKMHPCLWDFFTPDYRNKGLRDAAYREIAHEMNIDGFGINEVKTKIKILRSTYNQEIKKMNDTEKEDSLYKYTSNLRWLGEMEEVMQVDPNKPYKKRPFNDCIDPETGKPITPRPRKNKLAKVVSELKILNNEVNVSDDHLYTHEYTDDGTPEKSTIKKNIDLIKAISDLKTLNDQVNSAEETQIDAFAKSVGLQLKAFSVENALIGQQKIQNILTELGINDYREKLANQSNSSEPIEIWVQNSNSTPD